MKIDIEKYRVKGDRVIWITYIALMLISLIEVYSSMGKTVYEKGNGDIVNMFIKHFGIIVTGLFVTYFVHLIKYSYYPRITKIAYGFSLLLLLITLALGGISGKTADRWIVIPLIGQFQPSEIVKYILILYVSNELAILGDGIRDRKNFLTLSFKLLLICGLIFPENFSTALLVFMSCYGLMFIAGAKMKNLSLIVPALVVLVVFVVGIYVVNPDILKRSSTWVNRVEGFINTNPEEITQANTATMAISTGGLVGKGIGNTTQGRFLSESHNDFIFAIILEEGGVLYGFIVMILYFILFYRSVRIAKTARGLFGSYAAVGIGLVFCLQALVNMMVATTLMPVTGQTLPFISYGGTSFVISSAALGIMLNISADAKKYQMEMETDKMNLESKKIDLEEEITESSNSINEEKQGENERNF